MELLEWNPIDDARVADWASRSAFGATFDVAAGVRMGVWHDGTLVGFVGMIDMGGGMWGTQMVVAPELEGTSAAVRISQMGVAEARRRGAKMLLAFLHEENEPCGAVANRAGFQRLPMVVMQAHLGERDGD